MIGQGVGKLPNKHPSPHIPKTPIPENGINSKGQKKVTDQNGKIRFINMREGHVKGFGGVPVKN